MLGKREKKKKKSILRKGGKKSKQTAKAKVANSGGVNNTIPKSKV